MSGQNCKHGLHRDECAQCYNELAIPVDAYLDTRGAAEPMQRLEETRGRMCGRHKHRFAMFCDECFEEVMAERNRLLTLATKHCPRDHHDWQEILRIAGDA